MTRPAAETDATAGSAALALAQRAVSTVDTRTRRDDPFASRSSVGITLAYSRSRDPNTTPLTAIDHACKSDELVALPRPRSGEACLTVRDGRRIAACMRRYQQAGDIENAETCRELLETGLPRVLPTEYVIGP